MKASVYIETTVLSYLVSRPSRDLIIAAHQQLTQEWWRGHKERFNCYVSQAVIEEIRDGDPVEAQKRMEASKKLTILQTTDEVTLLAGDLVEQKVIPWKAARDAVHIAVAAANGMDFLLTWNCTHIANAQLEARISALCRARKYVAPVICTPEELMVG